MKSFHVVAAGSALALLCSSVAAADATYVTTFAGVDYMPFGHFILIVAIAFFALVMMKFCPEIEVLLGLISTTAFGIAMWYSPYISDTDVFAAIAGDGSMAVTYTQLITPQPVFQIFFGACFLFALVYTIYVLFLRQADAALDKKSIR